MNKRYNIFIILLVLCNICYGQNIQVIYHTDYTANAARPKNVKSEQTILIVGKESSEFYSPFRARIDSLVEAMEKRGASYAEYQTEKAKYPDSRIHFRIYKNYPEKGKLTFTDKFTSMDYKYTEPLEKIEWRTEKETKEILGYKCQKATAKFRGRMWTAWYTSAIPVQDGPWKLWGLPGLILEANDENSLYRFVAIGLEKTGAKPIAVRKKQYVNCTRNEYMEQKKIYEQNPIAALSRSSGNAIKITNSQGKQLPSNDREYIDIEID